MRSLQLERSHASGGIGDGNARIMTDPGQFVAIRWKRHGVNPSTSLENKPRLYTNLELDFVTKTYMEAVGELCHQLGKRHLVTPRSPSRFLLNVLHISRVDTDLIKNNIVNLLCYMTKLRLSPWNRKILPPGGHCWGASPRWWWWTWWASWCAWPPTSRSPARSSRRRSAWLRSRRQTCFPGDSISHRWQRGWSLAKPGCASTCH